MTQYKDKGKFPRFYEGVIRFKNHHSYALLH